MPISGPIVVIEDDIDDQEIVTAVLKELGVPNELLFFNSSSDAYTYLNSTTTQPFLILCDINLPKLNGMELKMQIDKEIVLRQKCVPFIFFSTAATKPIVTEAFTKMTVQGYFQKSSDMEELKHKLFIIMEYWKLCKHPNAEF
jgi:CheY-like chemotaxis protein